MSFAATQLIGFGAGGGPVGVSSISMVASAIGASNASSITLPAGINAGDLIVMADYCSDASSGIVTPTGFTSIDSSNANSQRMAVSYKLAVGTESGTSVTGMSCLAANGSPKLVYVFRGDVAATTITVSTPNKENTTGNPTAQTVSASGGVAPLVVLGFYGSTSAISPRTFTVGGSAAKDGEIEKLDTGIGETADLWIAYKIYNSGPQTVSIDMDDELSQILISCYVQMA